MGSAEILIVGAGVVGLAVAAELSRDAGRRSVMIMERHEQPEMAGIRPKLQGPGQPFRDFVIRHETARGLPGVINLVGIESPGLTCCLSIARMVRQMID